MAILATDICGFFDFYIVKESGKKEDGEPYHYRVIDGQGVFGDRYIETIDGLTECFDSMLPDYVDYNVEEDGFREDENSPLSRYEQLQNWIMTQKEYQDSYIYDWIMAVNAPSLIIDNTATEEAETLKKSFERSA